MRGATMRSAYSRLPALVTFVTVLALGAPAIGQTEVKEVQPLPAGAQLGPLELVRTSLSRVLAIVQSQPAGATLTGMQRAELRQAALEMFDFDHMSRRILKEHWKNGSPEEQSEFVRLFRELLERAYLRSIGSYPLASITYQGESINGSSAQVRSTMNDGKAGKTVAIEYRLFEADGRWAVYDVAVGGMSLVSSYRSQFNSVLRRYSFAEMLERLQNRVASFAPPGNPERP
jgi:phospholipid transport system substrate-binding protein